MRCYIISHFLITILTSFIFFVECINNQSNMYLYNLTLQRATGITQAIHGNFSGSKVQEILISHGKSLELVRPDPNTGKVHTILQTEVFGVVRSMMAFRLTGSTKGERTRFFCLFVKKLKSTIYFWLMKIIHLSVNSCAYIKYCSASLSKKSHLRRFDLKTIATFHI